MRTRPRPAFPASALILVLSLAAAAGPASGQYVPDRWSWETRDPSQVGMDAAALQEAIAIHLANESTAPRDQEEGLSLIHISEPTRPY